MMTALRSFPFLLLAPGTVAGYIPLVLLQRGPQFDPGLLALFSSPFWLVGGLVLLWSFWNFLNEGHGTPAPIDPPRQLVLKGFYQYVRNPMYLSVIFILIGHFLWSGYWSILAYAGLAFLVTHLFVIFYEEPALKRKFGATYEDYLRRVPRWIPKLTK
ncbi:MAG TPA: isoprenylcysteine carboxylmethyltransferase family protein [Anaerolineales bacterium]|nr:isoprenylcysteine carboxylmethyltransferase family protein [Anaerolineales bacterium]